MVPGQLAAAETIEEIDLLRLQNSEYELQVLQSRAVELERQLNEAAAKREARYEEIWARYRLTRGVDEIHLVTGQIIRK